MRIFRIYTEATGNLAERAEREIATKFEGFSSFRGHGVWKGEREESIVFEILTAEHNRALVLAAAENIRLGNGQEAVLVTASDIVAELI
jgi:hypothetical protein